MNASKSLRIPGRVILLQAIAMMSVFALTEQWIESGVLRWTVRLLLCTLLPMGIGEVYLRKRKSAAQFVVSDGPPDPWPASAELVQKLHIDRDRTSN